MVCCARCHLFNVFSVYISAVRVQKSCSVTLSHGRLHQRYLCLSRDYSGVRNRSQSLLNVKYGWPSVADSDTCRMYYVFDLLPGASYNRWACTGHSGETRVDPCLDCLSVGTSAIVVRFASGKDHNVPQQSPCRRTAS